MNKTIISAIAGVMLSTTAISAPLTDFFFANGYSKPDSIINIQTKIDDGTYYNYPYKVGGGVEKGLFKKKLKEGTALPQIKSVTALKAALDKKQVVLVADADGSVTGTLPVFVEIAKQNGVTGIELMDFLIANQLDDEDFFSNIDDVLSTVNAKIDEITAELNDEVSEEVAEEVLAEITKEFSSIVTPEALEAIGLDRDVAEDISREFEEINAELSTKAQELKAGHDPVFSSEQEALDTLAEIGVSIEDTDGIEEFAPGQFEIVGG